ncbi:MULTISPECIES: DUF397 domain-containing protein [Thermomonospora]|uniref:DUF397 domain-containing protein n=1 Tax=Thermomonospora curvata (strain ATCC 19995 / DSM 43183 / JCM 3096 / KCTC 9072 / NBRC 15933 / NCIMB 10081 / Henssen B9) TaxID=471852 RepID=D1AAL4_THECD|nr:MULTISPECIES: DUF397 domain-containing protein [Thermomonospora]ACY97024.1 protein of unknown function DUF397 [Thermomonospora curvata DSM 43183]PKK14908.1 MAG: DUF397 domain-containing protein [Thermomonospora sp. CIF 1]
MTTQYSPWRKSRHSAAGENCIEVARSAHGTIAIRDSKNTPGPVLEFTPHQWAAFLHTLRSTSTN